MIRNSTRKVTHQLYLCGAKIYSFLFLPVKLCHLSPPGLFLYGSLFPGKPWSIERCFWPLRCILNEDSSMHQILHTFHHFLCFTIALHLPLQAPTFVAQTCAVYLPSVARVHHHPCTKHCKIHTSFTRSLPQLPQHHPSCQISILLLQPYACNLLCAIYK